MGFLNSFFPLLNWNEDGDGVTAIYSQVNLPKKGMYERYHMPLHNTHYMMFSKQSSGGAHRDDWHSRVRNLSSVTILWLRCFDDWFDFYKPFIKKLAPMSLAKMSAFFARGPNQKWQQGLSCKSNFFTRAPRIMYEYTFCGKLTIRIVILTSFWH